MAHAQPVDDAGTRRGDEIRGLPGDFVAAHPELQWMHDASVPGPTDDDPDYWVEPTDVSYTVGDRPTHVWVGESEWRRFREG